MKKANSLLLLCMTLSMLHGHPTGYITQDSPPFFSDDFYKPTTDNMDDVYEHVVKAQKTPEPAYDYMITTTDSHGKEQP